MDIKSYYERQISLSEWFEHVPNFDQEAFRKEDNDKRERLKVLNKIIGIPYDKPTQFKATDLTNKTKKFKSFFNKHKNEYCALRLIPLDVKLPKLRMRGLSIEKAMEWYLEQNIDPDKYSADFIPHSENPIWSTIFIVNEKGIFGEIIKGMHNQLTQGYYDKNKPIQFDYDFDKLILNSKNIKAKKHLIKILRYLYVTSLQKQKSLTKLLNAKFANNYLVGYFETISTREFGLWFIDYNRILVKEYKGFDYVISKPASKASVVGKPGCVGYAKGIVKIVSEEDIRKTKFTGKEVLVCQMTSPDYIQLIKNSAAVVTDLGGILSHAAIIAREFNIPCIVAAGNATKILKDGQTVEVKADTGEVIIL